ncbi:tubby like protein 6 [Hibiscus trionum]|uniref:Tubby like protein 6 n=1 Tax=Hibiscus trionum TaxID=183268 RepID=A0A9W7I885_HIBTR|nr:tubby like protein 6 [Hibiscus trionum]
MALKNFIREIGNISKKSPGRKDNSRRGRSHIAPEAASSPFLLSGSSTEIEQGQWANLPPELLFDIMQRVEAKENCWPGRRDVVACAAVCQSWREITKEIVKTPEQCGFFTFPISLKQPGPREAPIQCFIRREKETSTYRLYMGLSPALSGDLSKQLLVAKKVRRATCTEFMIYLKGDDFSKSSNDYIGKLRSNFLGTKFNIFESQPQHDSSAQSGHQSSWKTFLKPMPSRVPMTNVSTAGISYELNVLRTKGPRRLKCTMYSIPVSAVEEGGTAPTPTAFTNCPEDDPSPPIGSKGKKPHIGFDSSLCGKPENSGQSTALVLRNKAPRWHEQLQCWCLNFKGRVTVASVKNFQLVASAEPSQNVSVAERDKVILQFGKIGKDIFTMDYRYPLSAFQAFAICLSSFGTKPVCE